MLNKPIHWAKPWFPTWMNHESLIGRDHRESHITIGTKPRESCKSSCSPSMSHSNVAFEGE